MALLLYLQIPPDSTIPVELELDAKVIDLYNLPEIKDKGYTIYFSGKALYKMDNMLSDIGICMESTLHANISLTIKKILRDVNLLLVLLNDNTIRNCNNMTQIQNVRFLGSQYVIMYNNKKIPPYLEAHNPKDICAVSKNAFYILTSNNDVYYIIAQRQSILYNKKVARNINKLYYKVGRNGILLWNNTSIIFIIEGHRMAHLQLSNIKDVSTSRYKSNSSTDIALLTDCYIYLGKIGWDNCSMYIIKHIPVNNIIQISIKNRVLGCMDNSSKITLYTEDDEPIVVPNNDKVITFALTEGCDYYDRVNVATII